MTHAITTYGPYQDVWERGEEYLEMAFSPSSRPVHDRWRNNGLSADFLADYFGTFIPKDLPESHHNKVKGAVAYIANELLENAMKFTAGNAPQPISLILNLSESDLRFSLTNCITSEAANALASFLDEFTSMDAGDFFVQQMERNIESGSESGLGFATMITDHNATLAWQLQPLSEDSTLLNTQVVIEL